MEQEQASLIPNLKPEIIETSNKITSSNNNDDIIVEDHEVVTLRDPVTFKRIDIAAKGKNCLHRKCFDLEVRIYLLHLIVTEFCTLLSRFQSVDMSHL